MLEAPESISQSEIRETVSLVLSARCVIVNTSVHCSFTKRCKVVGSISMFVWDEGPRVVTIDAAVKIAATVVKVTRMIVKVVVIDGRAIVGR